MLGLAKRSAPNVGVSGLSGGTAKQYIWTILQCSIHVPAAHISRSGVILKVHQPNKWHLIIDPSHSQGKSVNDGTPEELCSMICMYITIDDAVQRIVGTGFQEP